MDVDAESVEILIVKNISDIHFSISLLGVFLTIFDQNFAPRMGNSVAAIGNHAIVSERNLSALDY